MIWLRLERKVTHPNLLYSDRCNFRDYVPKNTPQTSDEVFFVTSQINKCGNLLSV